MNPLASLTEPKRRAPRADKPDDDVEMNSDASFPASDPPSWTPIARVGEPRQSAPSGRGR